MVDFNCEFLLFVCQADNSVIVRCLCPAAADIAGSGWLFLIGQSRLGGARPGHNARMKGCQPVGI
jgi:hypothetical protein